MEGMEFGIVTLLGSKMIFDGRQPLLEDDLCWKTTIDGRCPLKEDNLWWKTTLRKPCPEMCKILIKWITISSNILVVRNHHHWYSKPDGWNCKSLFPELFIHNLALKCTVLGDIIVGGEHILQAKFYLCKFGLVDPKHNFDIRIQMNRNWIRKFYIFIQLNWIPFFS